MTWPALAGIALLAGALACLWLGHSRHRKWYYTVAGFACLAVVLGLDLYLIAHGQASITRIIHGSFTDLQRGGILLFIFAATCLPMDRRFLFPCAVMVIAGHLFW